MSIVERAENYSKIYYIFMNRRILTSSLFLKKFTKYLSLGFSSMALLFVFQTGSQYVGAQSCNPCDFEEIPPPPEEYYEEAPAPYEAPTPVYVPQPPQPQPVQYQPQYVLPQPAPVQYQTQSLYAPINVAQVAPPPTPFFVPPPPRPQPIAFVPPPPLYTYPTPFYPAPYNSPYGTPYATPYATPYQYPTPFVPYTYPTPAVIPPPPPIVVNPPAGAPITNTNTNTNNNTNTATATVSAPAAPQPVSQTITQTVTREVIREVPVTREVVRTVSAPQQPVVVRVAGVQTEAKELPKTGLPLLAWAAAAFIPVGFTLKRFKKINIVESANYIWEEREYQRS